MWTVTSEESRAAKMMVVKKVTGQGVKARGFREGFGAMAGWGDESLYGEVSHGPRVIVHSLVC